ncbi:MAG: type II toxin-antitoxin system HigB family toxin [Burkholderiaceae bacterium]
MKVVGRDKLDAFCAKHTDARKWIENWLAEAETATWSTPQQIRNRYSSASFLRDNLVTFNVKGNAYRLEAVVAYKTGVVVVTWIGSHAAYDARNKAR